MERSEDSGCAPIGGTLPFCDWLRWTRLRQVWKHMRLYLNGRGSWMIRLPFFPQTSGYFCLLAALSVEERKQSERRVWLGVGVEVTPFWVDEWKVNNDGVRGSLSFRAKCMPLCVPLGVLRKETNKQLAGLWVGNALHVYVNLCQPTLS